MANVIENETPPTKGLNPERVAEFLGGAKILRRPLRSPLDAHEMILNGLPAESLRYLLDNLLVIKMTAALENAVGMSLRTIQRLKKKPAIALNQEQSGRTWKFAEILARATEVFGSKEEAEKWLERPAIGLDRRRPIDLLGTPAGVELIENFLTQLDYGVYV